MGTGRLRPFHPPAGSNVCSKFEPAVHECPELALQLFDPAKERGQELVLGYLKELLVAENPATRLKELLESNGARPGIVRQGKLAQGSSSAEKFEWEEKRGIVESSSAPAF